MGYVLVYLVEGMLLGLMIVLCAFVFAAKPRRHEGCCGHGGDGSAWLYPAF